MPEAMSRDLDFESRVLNAGGSSSACDATYAGVGVFHLHGMGLIPPRVWIADGELPHPKEITSVPS